MKLTQLNMRGVEPGADFDSSLAWRLGHCWGGKLAASPTGRGHILIPLDQAVECWRVCVWKSSKWVAGEDMLELITGGGAAGVLID